MTNQEVIDKLVPIYQNVEVLTAEAKEVLAEAKSEGLDQAVLAKIAKAVAQSKLDDLAEKTKLLSDLIEEVQQ